MISTSRNQLQREREETRDMVTSESKAIQDSMDITVKDILDVIKKEKSEREREIEHVKKRVDDEKEELKLTINRDRDNLTKKMNEEHDQRRIEQLEMTQRLGKISFQIKLIIFSAPHLVLFEEVELERIYLKDICLQTIMRSAVRTTCRSCSVG